MNKAIVLLSGGLDSVVSLACIIDNFDEVYSLTFDYSQKSVNQEINAAKQIAEFYGIENRVIKLDWLGQISNSVLNNSDNVPNIKENELENSQITKESAKSVWVPNRNALFINIAACFAEAKECDTIVIGANKEEAATFIDNSKEFINAINSSLEYSVNSKIQVKAPLLNKAKDEIVQLGIDLKIPFDLIFSCYNSSEKHCGKCESCSRLKRALKNLKRTDIIDNIFG